MIKTAQTKYKQYSNLIFKVQNVETIEDTDEYDVVISLFGLHWMNDIFQVAKIIFSALKTSGKLMFFVPIEKIDLYNFRKDFIQKSKWSECFDNNSKNIRPFIADKEDYIKAFEKYFRTDKDKKTEVVKHYKEDKFIKFLSSWMPEIRHICDDQKYQAKKDAISYMYVKELIESFKYLDAENIVVKDDEIIFTEHVFSYEGTKVSGLDSNF